MCQCTSGFYGDTCDKGKYDTRQWVVISLTFNVKLRDLKKIFNKPVKGEKKNHRLGNPNNSIRFRFPALCLVKVVDQSVLK